MGKTGDVQAYDPDGRLGALLARFERWLSGGRPEETLASMSPEERDRIRNVGIGCVVAALGYLGSVVEGIRLWHAVIGFGSLAAATCILGALLLLRRAVHYSLVGHLVLSIVLVAQGFILVGAGGFENPAVVVLFAIPIGAAVLINVRASIIWGALTFAMLVALWVLQQTSIQIASLPFEPGDANVLVNRGIVLLAIVVMIAVFVSSQNAAEARMRRSHAEFERESAYVKLLMSTTIAANESETLRDAIGRCLREVCELKSWPLAHAYEAEPPDDARRSVLYVSPDVGENHSRFVHEASNLLADTSSGGSSRLPRIEGGLWDSRVATSTNPYRRALAEQLDLSDRVLVMIEIGFEQWVMEFFSTERLEPDAEFIAVLRSTGTQLSRVLERSRSRSRIRDLAYSDSLTGLPNRRHLGESLEQHLANSGREGHVVLIHVGLDRFKTINNALGHTAGDKLLRQVSDRLLGAVAGSGEPTLPECVFRLGGDEFAVVLAGVRAPSVAAILAQRMLETLAVPMQVDGDEVFSTASLGIAISEIDADKAPALLRCADSALAASKREGGGRLCFYAEALNEASSRRMFLEHQLHHAISRDELTLAYQPLMDATTNEMVAAEALLRWTTGNGEQISPAEFIPVAETSGQMAEIGRWVLQRAAEQLADWRARGIGPRRLAINTSVVQLRDPNFVDTVTDVLGLNQLPAGCVELEITESRLIGSDEIVFDCLDRLRDAGVSLALDDFGTGYSSLSQLKRLPIEKLKIDRSFIDGIETDGSNSALIEAVVQIGRGLGLTIVAEGVENEAQAAILRAKGADELQGYLFSRPIPAAELEVFEPTTVVAHERAKTQPLARISSPNPVVG